MSRNTPATAASRGDPEALTIFCQGGVPGAARPPAAASVPLRQGGKPVRVATVYRRHAQHDSPARRGRPPPRRRQITPISLAPIPEWQQRSSPPSPTLPLTTPNGNDSGRRSRTPSCRTPPGAGKGLPAPERCNHPTQAAISTTATRS